MNKWMIVIALIAMSAACGGNDDTTPSPRRTEQTSSGLSTSFANQCARCHGETGEGQDKYPKIPGDKDQPGFVALVRAGRGEMPPFTTSQISDADLEADYAWLTTKR